MQSFCDSNGDGIGDLNGLTSKLDYLQELGVEAIWLMPFHPSPSYHKYDVKDYYGIHPDYGTLDDFKRLVNRAHQRNIRIVMDLVINHCSAEHPWFKAAISNPGSPFRDYFIWATDEEIEELGNATKEVAEDSDNIIQWNDVPGQEEKYFSYFWSGMPDLNYDNPKLRKDIYKIGRFWLEEMKVDGFRLDAAKHIYPDNRAPDNHDFWVEFRQEMEQVNPEVHLIGEVWDKAEVIAPFFKGLKSNFNFDLGYAITDAVRIADGSTLIDNFIEINDYYHKITNDFYDAIFLRNHDQERVMSLFRGNEAKARLAASILFTLPGSPFIYYGEELGMKGRKPDKFIREPFPWGNGEPGQTTWMKPKYNSKISNLAEQQADSRSIYHHYKSLIHLRRQHEILSLGGIEKKTIKNKKVCSFIRTYNVQSMEVIHNLSGKVVAILTEREDVVFQSGAFTLEKGSLELPGYSSVILR